MPSISVKSTTDKIREVEHIVEELGEWQGVDPNSGFQLVKTAGGQTLKIADLVDDDPAKREKVSEAVDRTRDVRQRALPSCSGQHLPMIRDLRRIHR